VNPFDGKVTVLKEISKLIPGNLIPKLAGMHGVDKDKEIT